MFSLLFSQIKLFIFSLTITLYKKQNWAWQSVPPKWLKMEQTCIQWDKTFKNTKGQQQPAKRWTTSFMLSVWHKVKLHNRWRTGDKPYLCFECDKTFTTFGEQSGHLKMHKMSSTGELDGVNPVDNQTLHQLAQHLCWGKNVTCDTWHGTLNTRHVTPDTWHVNIL